MLLGDVSMVMVLHYGHRDMGCLGGGGCGSGGGGGIAMVLYLMEWSSCQDTGGCVCELQSWCYCYTMEWSGCWGWGGGGGCSHGASATVHNGMVVVSGCFWCVDNGVTSLINF